MSKPKIVRHEFDLRNPPPLTEEQRQELEALAALPDDTIDYSDIPEAGDAFFANAVRNPFFRPVKKQLTLRLDADLIEWFKSHGDDKQGRGYQTRINEALREYVTSEQQHSKKSG